MKIGKKYVVRGGKSVVVCHEITKRGNAVVSYTNFPDLEFLVRKELWSHYEEAISEITKWVALTENINSVLVTYSADSKEELLSSFVNTSRIFSVEKVTFRKGNNL